MNSSLIHPLQLKVQLNFSKFVEIELIGELNSSILAAPELFVIPMWWAEAAGEPNSQCLSLTELSVADSNVWL